MVFYLQINVIFAFELLVGSFKFKGFHSKFFIKILFNHRTPLNSLNSLRDRLAQKMTKYIIKVWYLSVFRWTKNNSELWYIAILQKRSHLKNSVFWFSLVSCLNIKVKFFFYGMKIFAAHFKNSQFNLVGTGWKLC